MPCQDVRIKQVFLQEKIQVLLLERFLSLLIYSIHFNRHEQQAHTEATAVSEGRSAYLFESAGWTLAGLGLVASTMVALPFVLDSSEVGSLIGSPEQDLASPRENGILDGCWKMAICDSHARYDDYGVIALPLVMFYPG